ncbi:uncharacterized protein F4812DRAFT_97691 [Daldinia caldariorum]|uniref:uncharacterized protein n=1 Tax=Daldinia caldariorum TaxID=326644 RepID=UPI002007A661|nr:uncharacterized protein F4812DRAFT_97691 [Daldinia caldariorum]KAI1466123.1 hypothetical protein F4812DRAFT_97691 [Daldinia caldariorum]
MSTTIPYHPGKFCLFISLLLLTLKYGWVEFTIILIFLACYFIWNGLSVPPSRPPNGDDKMTTNSITFLHASESPFDTSLSHGRSFDRDIYTAKQIADFVLSISQLTDDDIENAQNLARNHGILDNWEVPSYVPSYDEIYSFGCVIAIAHFYNELSNHNFRNEDIPKIYEKCVRAINSLTHFLQTPHDKSARLPSPVKLSMRERWKLDRTWDISVCLLGAIKARCGFQRRTHLGSIPIVHNIHYRKAARLAFDENKRFGKGRICQKTLGLLTREDIEPFVQPMCLVKKLQYKQDINDPDSNHFKHSGCTPESCTFDVEPPNGDYHIPGCPGCGKSKPQNEASANLRFREIANNGMPAVSISDPSNYWVAADHDTLVVSHVWRDGIWGTKEDGINKCVHDQLVRIAQDNGCTSYWIDCAIIPGEDQATRERMIMMINWTFTNARLVLCWDRNIASLGSDTETILLSLIVSSWHRRAWTLLEGNRGQQKRITFLRWVDTSKPTYELFRLSDVLNAVFRKPNIRLWILSALVELLPYSDMPLSVDAAGLLLSGRHASRQGDSEVIWGLLRPIEARNGADDFSYKDPYIYANKKVDVAFISSNAERFKIRGTPSWRPGKTNATTWVRTAYGGIKADIVDGNYGKKYLHGKWWMKTDVNIKKRHVDWAESSIFERNEIGTNPNDCAFICPILMGDPRSDTSGGHSAEPIEGFFRTSVVMECKRAIFITRGEDDVWLWRGMVKFENGHSLFFTTGEAKEITIGGPIPD